MLNTLTIRQRLGWSVVAISLLAMGVAPSAAQAVRGTMLGTVKDSTGASLPGVTVEMRHLDTGVAQSVVTDERGRYNRPDLPLGDYEVQATLVGFQGVLRRGVTLAVGSQLVIDFTLSVGQIQETITVNSESPIIDVVSAAVGAVVEQKQLEDLPLNGRNFSQLITLAPGANQIQFGNAGGNAFFGRQPNFSISGSRPEGQAILLDNTNIQGFWNRGAGSGVLGTTLGVEAIAEFQTLTNTYSAQFGGNGSVINAVTKSGGNAFHGSLFEYLRDSSMDAKNFFDGDTKPPFKRNQFGGSAGGPLKQNKAFFFATYEGIRQEQGFTRIATVPDQLARQGIIPINGVLTNVGVHPAIAPVLALYPLPTTSVGGGLGTVNQVATSDGHEDYFLGRTDYTVSDKDSLFARYVRDTAGIIDPFAGGDIPLWRADQNTSNQYLTIESRRIVSASIINQVRFGFVRTREKAEILDSYPALNFFEGRQDGQVNGGGGITSFGPLTTLPVELRQNKYSVADDMYWNKGSHSLKFGVLLDVNRTLMFQPFQVGGVWTFNGVQSLLTNTPSLLVGALPGQDAATVHVDEMGVTSYLQDEWRAASTLTLNLGLRYSYMVNPSVDPATALVDGGVSPAFTPVDHAFANNPTLKNFDPRIGIVFDPFEHHKTVFRAGFGTFHNLISPRIIGPNYVNNPPYGFGRQVNPTSFPIPFTSTSANPLTQQNGLDYASDSTPYQMQWNVNVQRELMANTSLTIGYVGSRGVDLLRQRDVNPVLPTTLADSTVIYGVPRGAAAGITPNPRLNPTFAALISNLPAFSSTYRSLQVSLNRRLQHSVQGQLAYTLSRCRDVSSGSFGGEGSTPATNPYDSDYDYGPCHFDRTHNLRASAIVELPFHGNMLVEGWQISTVVSAVSGPPFTPAVGFDQSGLQTANQRPNLASGRDIDDVVIGDINQWFDPTAFTLPAAGTLGTVNRHSLRGPGLVTVDMSVIKDLRFPSVSEAFNVQFRVEVFNLLNRANFGLPNANIFAQTPNGGGSYSPTAGRITTAAQARQLQLALRLRF